MYKVAICEEILNELEIVDLIAGGYSNGDIAKMLFISVYTVNDQQKISIVS